jgi:hypothetical protein
MFMSQNEMFTKIVELRSSTTISDKNSTHLHNPRLASESRRAYLKQNNILKNSTFTTIHCQNVTV